MIANQSWIKPYMGSLNLNVGCGGNHLEGFRNLDKEEWWLGQYSAPFRTDSVDCILASHVMEHVPNIIKAMGDIHRVLKPGGYFIAITPYASSDDAWEDPTHVRAFTEISWYYFDKRLYERKGHSGNYKSDVDYIFNMELCNFVLYPKWANKPEAELQYAKRHYRNVVQELQVVLKAVKNANE